MARRKAKLKRCPAKARSAGRRCKRKVRHVRTCGCHSHKRRSRKVRKTRRKTRRTRKTRRRTRRRSRR